MKSVKRVTDGLGSMEERIIAQHGWAIRGVFESEDGEVPSFAFTVGLHDRGCPELITLGVQYLIAGRLLNELAEQLVQGERKDARLVSGPVAMEGWPVKFYLLPCSPGDLEGDMAKVLERSGGSAAVAQVCWSDEMGRFPWEPGYSASMLRSQPVLGTPPGALH